MKGKNVVITGYVCAPAPPCAHRIMPRCLASFFDFALFFFATRARLGSENWHRSGTSGIGAALAKAYAGEGAKVVIGGRREAEGARVAAAAGESCTFVANDVCECSLLNWRLAKGKKSCNALT